MVFTVRSIKFAVIISIIWHLFWFNALEFSFKSPVLQDSYNLSFLGAFLDSFDFSSLNLSVGNVKVPLIQLKDKEVVLKSASYGPGTLNMSIVKPYLFYSGIARADFINISAIGRDNEARDKANALIQKLPNPFFYKEILPAGLVAEARVFSFGGGFWVKRILSSGDLEVDLFALKELRRRLHLGVGLSGRRLKKIKVELENDG